MSREALRASTKRQPALLDTSAGAPGGGAPMALLLWL
jgi:hypothetical protein